MLVLLCAWVISACRAEPKEPLLIEVWVKDDRLGPLAEVPVFLGEQVAATSDAQGRATLRVARAVATLGLRARCPEAYRPAAPLSLPAEPVQRVRLNVVCRPKLRTLALIAFAPSAPGTMVRADGRPIGRIGADGTLHAVVRRPPGATLRLTFGADDSQPKELLVADRDQIVFYEPSR